MINTIKNEDFFNIINLSLKDCKAKALPIELFQTVVKAMSHSQRVYHNNYHLQEMTLISDNHISELEKLPINNLNEFLAYIRISGFFHDTVYIQTDGSIYKEFTIFLSKNLEHHDKNWIIKSLNNDYVLEICAKIFQIPLNTVIPEAKLNEFLSAVIAGNILDSIHLDRTIIAKIIACIESTVPFRSQEDFTNRTIILSTFLSEQDVQETMYASVYLANKDCYNFSGYEHDSVSERCMKFLQNSWRLKLESIPNIKEKPILASYFMKLLTENISFFKYMLSSEKYKDIFHHYKEYPNQSKQVYFEERAKELLQYAIVSHSIKLVSTSIFAVFDELDSENFFPLSLQSDLSYVFLHRYKEEYFASHHRNNRSLVGDKAIIDSLTCGKNYPSAAFDGGKSPIGKFLYRALSESSILNISDFLDKNKFFLYKNNTDKNEKAKEYIYYFKRTVGDDIFNVITNTLKDVFNKLESQYRFELTYFFQNTN